MFCIIDNHPVMLLQIGNRIMDHLQVFVKRRFQYLLDMKIPCFTKNSYNRRFRFQKRNNIMILRYIGIGSSGTAKSRHFRLTQIDLSNCLKKLDILRIRSWPSTFHIMNTQIIKLLSNHNLVSTGKGNPLPLRPISESSVVYLYLFHV